MNIQKMLKEAQRMQEKLSIAQAELAHKTVEASAGGGKVLVKATGTGDILEIKIHPSVVSPDDVEALEDLILAGVKMAQQAAREAAEADIKKVTGGLNIPGLGAF